MKTRLRFFSHTHVRCVRLLLQHVENLVHVWSSTPRFLTLLKHLMQKTVILYPSHTADNKIRYTSDRRNERVWLEVFVSAKTALQPDSPILCMFTQK